MSALVTSFLLGAAAGTLLTLSIAYSRVGRILARVFAVCAMGCGAGLLTWSLQALISGQTLRAICVLDVSIAQPSEALGWSAALLTAGITALVLSFIGGRARPV